MPSYREPIFKLSSAIYLVLLTVLFSLFSLAAKSQDDSTRVRVLFELASQSSGDSALIYLDSARTLSIEANLDKSLAKALHKIGTVYRHTSVYDKALDNYFEALRIAEEMSDSIQISDINSSIGNVYLNTDELDDALKYFEKSREISKANNDSFGVMVSYINTGAANQKMRNLCRKWKSQS